MDSSRPITVPEREFSYGCTISAYVLVLGPSRLQPCPLSAKGACYLFLPRRVTSTITYFLPCQISHSELSSLIGPILGIVRELGVSISRTEYSDTSPDASERLQERIDACFAKACICMMCAGGVGPCRRSSSSSARPRPAVHRHSLNRSQLSHNV